MIPGFKSISILVALCISMVSAAQEVRQTKKSIESVNDTIRNIKEFNTDGFLIFQKEIQYWDDKTEHIFIDGFVYSGKKVEYEYHATENFLRLIRYEYDSLSGLKDQFVKHTDKELIDNEILNSIENREQLILQVESVIPKDSELTNILDPNEYHTLVKKGNKEIYTRYENNKESVRVVRKYDNRENLKCLEERNRYQTTVTKYKYNRNNQLVKEAHGFDDYLSKTSYFYENNSLIKSTTTNKKGDISTTNYFYSDGVLTKMVRTKPEGTITHMYSYEYY